MALVRRFLFSRCLSQKTSGLNNVYQAYFQYSQLPTFQVKRCEPEVVVPAKPTPLEVKKLSDIDEHRILFPMIWFYKNNRGKDPVKVIREALGRVLVYYYPLAGRLKEGSDRKLMVDCNGKGVLFIEADADIKLDQLGHPIQPPFPFLDEVLYNVPGSDNILGSPLLLVQVTRLLCGGFILALRLNHTMLDGFGLLLFMNAWAEMACGAQHPSIPPVWNRDLLDARNPPRITRVHHEFQQGINDDQIDMDTTQLVNRCFFFGPNEIMAIRKHLLPHHPHLSSSSTKFELITACIWKCRTLALDLDPEEVVQVSIVFNGRGKDSLDLPLGYYGPVVASPSVVSKAGDLCGKPLGYAVELVRKTKTENMDAEYIRSAADFLVTKGRPGYKLRGNYYVSNITHLGYGDVDFGYGKAEYGGPPKAYVVGCYHVKHRYKGHDGSLAMICLPFLAMARFQKELEKIIK
ncbi:alcohol acyl transferase 1 allele RGa-like [Ziziphus jujuba]|uniref:Alcohol acyl transferase 1 allele RGa-like n=1 Tax=Ziziphus jujuba TaxID=326968 RepID=A0A6P4ABV5_ZIZJJ|nr:alcohol acyl transferase 1 allele RGa-like [Ziziphus jujuba]